ncbi:MAG: LacI family DNA-binding transcriptional regulator [Clostridiales bacterium]|nr:LacI family DNA-binding transcriptional regulator [Clostridiales bacterium]
MAGIKDVAKEAGVSVATVSYVINKNKYVSPELTRKVIDSIEKLSYYTNPVARSLRNRKTGIIGVVLQNIRNIFFPQLLAGLEEYTRAHNYSLSFFNTYNDPDTEKNVISTLKNMWVDGMIIDSCVEEKDEAAYVDFLDKNLTGKKIPVVFLERNPGSSKHSAVRIDNFSAGFEATNHLVKTGRNRLLHIAGAKDWSMVVERLKGFQRALEENALSDKAVIRYGNLRPQDGYEIMKDVLMHNLGINGVFAANDQMALGAMKAIKEFGLNIPADISVVGFDNIFVSTMIEPTLTTINVPKYAMGAAAARIVIEAVEKPGWEPEVLTLQANLIVRQSTDLLGDKNWELYGW